MRHAAHAVTDLRLSRDAVAMAKQLAKPDGNVVFQQHPLRNTEDDFTVSATEAGGVFGAEPYRQLLAYGLARITERSPAYVDEWLERYPWQVVLTERGREWVAAGCPTNIEPPVSAMARGRTRRAA